jgi:hypothetical protein
VLGIAFLKKYIIFYVLILNNFFKKKYYFNRFLNKNHFKKQSLSIASPNL